MFELTETNDDDNDIITMMMDENNIEQLETREALRPLLISLLCDDDRTDFETTVTVFIALYVAREFDYDGFREYLTKPNIDAYFNDDAMMLCQDGQNFGLIVPETASYNFFDNLLCFMAEQFIVAYDD